MLIRVIIKGFTELVQWRITQSVYQRQCLERTSLTNGSSRVHIHI